MKKKYLLATIILLIVSAFLVNLSYAIALNVKNEVTLGDVNGDGSITGEDALKILRWIAKLIPANSLAPQ